MMRFFTVFTFILLLSSNTFSSEYYKNAQASSRIDGAIELWYKSDADVPSFIRFAEDFNLDENEVFSWLKEEFNLSDELDFNQEKVFSTQDKVKHIVFQPKFRGVAMEFQRITLHVLNGEVISISGNIPGNINVSNTPALSKSDAIKKALNEVKAVMYKWEFPEEEQWLQERTGNKSATFYPQPELVIFPDMDKKTATFKYAFKMNVYAAEPYSCQDVYINAHDGSVLFVHNLLMEADSTGLAHTAYSGPKEITTDLDGQFFYLRESNRGNGIHTWNLNQSTNYSTRTEFKDEDNNWIYAQGDQDAYATDAHWAAEQGYDYLHAAFGRNSIDDNGFSLESYIHYGEAFKGSFWDAQNRIMVFGDGSSHLVPYTTIDIVGHEIGHGLTQFTANLINYNESGALSESFSDILGNCIEHFGKPGHSSWRIGEDRGSFIRDMSFPNAKDHPDTYLGEFWYTGTSDNGGVHINCGVQNYWFYLLSEGGNGVNDHDQSYQLDGIGIMNAALISYRTLRVYLTPNSDFEEVNFFSTLAAKDLFGACSPQHEATVLAWNAVGMANEYIDHTVADFEADAVDYCNVPFGIAFENTSINGQSYLWDFGDGSTSTEMNPVHEYFQAGEYTVTLKVDGDGCGDDMRVVGNLVTVSGVESPRATSTTAFKGDSVLLSASVESGEIHWYSDMECENLIWKGNDFQSPALYQDATYYLKSIRSGLEHNIGLDIEMSRGQSGSYADVDKGLVFNVYQDLILASVKVDAEGDGIATLTIRDESGMMVFKKDVDLVSGIQEIEMNAELTRGEDYVITVGFPGGSKKLWLSDASDFPYQQSGLISIVENTEGSEAYPFIYNWKVKEFDCESGVESVSVSVRDINEVSLPSYNFYVNNSNGLNYFIDFFFKQNTSVEFGLYGINGQLVYEVQRDFQKGENTVDINNLLELSSNPTGVYFITINGGGIEETEKIVNKGGSN